MADQYRVVNFQNERSTGTWPPGAQETYGNNTPLYSGYNPVRHSIPLPLIIFFFPFLSFLSLVLLPHFLPSLLPFFSPRINPPIETSKRIALYATNTHHPIPPRP